MTGMKWDKTREKRSLGKSLTKELKGGVKKKSKPALPRPRSQDDQTINMLRGATTLGSKSKITLPKLNLPKMYEDDEA